MTDLIPDLIARIQREMESYDPETLGDDPMVFDSWNLLHDAKAALESLSAPPASDDYEAGYAEGFHHGLSTPRGSAEDDRNAVLPASGNEPQSSDGPDYHADHAFWAARQPASDDEREGLADAIHDYRVGSDAAWTTHVDDEGIVHSEDHGFADAILAAGFRRLSPSASDNEREAPNLLRYAVQFHHPEFGKGWFFSPDAVESLVTDVRSPSTEPVARQGTHNHGAEDGQGLSCNELRLADGSLLGSCMLPVSLSPLTREALDELQDLIDDTAKPSKFPYIGLSNPREVAEAITARFSVPEPAEVEWVFSLVWDGEPSMSGAPHKKSVGTVFGSEEEAKDAARKTRIDTNSGFRIEKQLRGPWVSVEKGAE